MSRKMPKELFVWKENAGEDDEYLATAEAAKDAAPEPGNTRFVTRYELKEVVRISSVVQVDREK